MVVGMTLPVSAADTGEVIQCEGGVERSTYSVGEPVWEDSITSRAATITVYITSPCDQSFRSRYSDYAYQANRVVERPEYIDSLCSNHWNQWNNAKNKY